MKNPISSLTLLESLESRLAPAGLVTLSVSAGVLSLTGDALANDLQITESGDFWTISAQAGGTTEFRMNGGPVLSSITFAAPLSLKASMGAGADDLLLDGLSLPGTLTLDTGDGHDSVDLTSTFISGLATVRMGTGSDYFTAGGELFFGKGLSVDLGNGANTFDVNAVTLQSNGNISALAGGTTIEKQTFILAAGSAVVNGAVTLRTTTSSATDFEIGDVLSDSLRVTGAMTLQSVSGDDAVFLRGDVDVGGLLTMNLSNGTNTVVSTNLEILRARGLSYIGGAGQDNVAIEGTQVTITGNISASMGAGSNQLFLDAANSLRVSGAVGYTGGIGNDTLIVEGPDVVINGALSMVGSNGLNALYLNATVASVGAVSFSAGAGNDVVDIGQYQGDSSLVSVRGNVTLNTGTGSADVMVRDADIYGNLNLATNVQFGGVDTLRIFESDVRGTTYVNMAGWAESDVVVRDSIFDRAVTINTGNGDDYVAFDTDTDVSSIYSVFDGYVRVNLGAGNDIFAAGSSDLVSTVGNDFNYYVDVNGGTGYDRAYFMHAGYNNGFNGPLPWTYSVEEAY